MRRAVIDIFVGMVVAGTAFGVGTKAYTSFQPAAVHGTPGDAAIEQPWVTAEPKPRRPGIVSIQAGAPQLQPSVCHRDGDDPCRHRTLGMDTEVRVCRRGSLRERLHVIGECHLVNVSLPWQHPFDHRMVDVTLQPGVSCHVEKLHTSVLDPRRNWRLRKGAEVGAVCRVISQTDLPKALATVKE